MRGCCGGQVGWVNLAPSTQVAGHNGAPLPPRAATTEPWMHPDSATAGAASPVWWGGRPTEEGRGRPWSPDRGGRSDGGSSLQQYPASRVRTAAAEGTLSSWSNEIRTQDALHLFAVSWDEEAREFKHIGAAAVWQQEQGAVLAANLAAAKASETIESRRSVLGMKGTVAEGPDNVELPMTNAEKARAMGGGASSGPIHSAITERALPTKRLPMGIPEERAFAELLATEGVRGTHSLRQTTGASCFAFLQQDENEGGVFYYEQQGADNPAGTGFVKWRLKCVRDHEW